MPLPPKAFQSSSGEYGLPGFDQHTGVIEQGEKLKFLNLSDTTQGKTDDNYALGQRHFGRTSFTWSDQQLFNMIQASWNGRSSTAETDQVYLKQHEPVQDVKIPLHLNGNRFSLKNGTTPLLRGRDYTTRNGVLTLKSDLLSRLTTEGKLGVNATLTAGFSEGADWTFNIIQYNTPVLNDAQGTTSAFAIPVIFGGDQLATMEATYANGENAPLRTGRHLRNSPIRLARIMIVTSLN